MKDKEKQLDPSTVKLMSISIVASSMVINLPDFLYGLMQRIIMLVLVFVFIMILGFFKIN